MVLVVVVAMVTRHLDALRFWVFVRFDVRLRDAEENAEDLPKMDYDAFLNYRCGWGRTGRGMVWQGSMG